MQMDALLPALQRFVNPWELDVVFYLAGWLVTRVGIGFWDNLVIGLVKAAQVKPLPTRTDPGKPVRYMAMDAISWWYLGINSFLEWTFVLNLLHFLWHSPAVPKQLTALNPLNTFAGLYVMFAVMDFFYAPAHRFLHWTPVYPYVHKHHHRQVFPAQGYLDAGNEHPVEQLVGLSCTWLGVYAAVHFTGAHALTIFIFFNLHAALAMLNHSPYDVEFSVLGFTYSVKAHEMHHRMFTTNYAQYFMFWDHVMGTFTEYHYRGFQPTEAPKPLGHKVVNQPTTKVTGSLRTATAKQP